MHIQSPANANAIFSVLMQIAAFEMIPTDSIYKDMIAELDQQDVDFDEVQFSKLSGQGFDSVWLIPNLGSITFFMCLYPILLALIPLALMCGLKFFRCAKLHKSLKH